MKWWWAGVCLLLSLAASGVAQAAAKDPAVTLVEQAAEAYRAGRYVGAAELFEAAFELSKAPVQLRNAAKAYSKAGRWDDATATWRRYAAQPGVSAAEKAEADAELRAIEAKQAALRAEADAEAARAEAKAAEARAQAAVQSPPPAPAVVVARPAPSRPVVAYALVGVGAAAVITSAVLYFHAGARLSDLDTALADTDAAGRIVGISHDDAQAELSGVEGERTASLVLLTAGLAAAAGGAVWWALAGDEAPVEASLVPVDGGAFAQAGLRF